ncbi:MAG: hypothetical protein IJX65_00520 [Alistipes sp.]|nr:hypothetical protein [Alistipes sp.]
MKKTLFIFATEAEAALLRAQRPDLQIAICGVGLVESACAMAEILERERPEQVVLCGIAGAYDKALQVGDVVAVVEERTATLPAAYRKSYYATIGLPLKGVVSNSVMSVGAQPLGAQVENMEGAAIFALCAAQGVLCGQIRAISNYTTDKREQWDIPAALKALTETIDRLYR